MFCVAGFFLVWLLGFGRRPALSGGAAGYVEHFSMRAVLVHQQHGGGEELRQ